MIRTTLEIGGRQARNEDFTRYLQLITLLEGLYGELNLPDFIVQGVEFTDLGGTFDVSEGVIFQGGELCLFDGASAVGLPYILEKTTLGVNPRLFFDASTKTTANKLYLAENTSGSFSLDENTKRASDLMPRVENGNVVLPIDLNDSQKVNIWRSLGSDRAENMRVVPKPTADKYLLLGTFPKSATQFQTIAFSGLTNNANIGTLSFGFRSEPSINAPEGTVTYSLAKPTIGLEFYTKDNSGTGNIELWVRSPQSDPVQGDFSTGVFSLLADVYSDAVNRFEFEDAFTWTTLPTGLIAFAVNDPFGDSKAVVVTAISNCTVNGQDIGKVKTNGNIKVINLRFEITVSSSGPVCTLGIPVLFPNIPLLAIDSVIENSGGIDFDPGRVIVRRAFETGSILRVENTDTNGESANFTGGEIITVNINYTTIL